MFQFGVLLEALRVFLGFDFCPDLILPITVLKSRVLPLGSTLWTTGARVWNLVKFKFFFNYLVWSSHCEYHNQFHLFSHTSSVWFKFIYSQPFRTQRWPLKCAQFGDVVTVEIKQHKTWRKINANLYITHAKLIKATWSKISRWH